MPRIFDYMFSDDNDWGNPTYYVIKANCKYFSKIRADYNVSELSSSKLHAAWVWKNVADHLVDMHKGYYNKIKAVKIHWWNLLWWWLKMEDRDC